MKVPTPVTWKLDTKLSEKHKSPIKNITIGVLALQGDFLEHILTLKRLGVNSKEVRLPKDLEEINGLIIPGGESTTMANLLDVFSIRNILIKKINNGMPVWGTCAGMILLSKKIVQDKPVPLGVMDIVVSRNAFGRQIDSFEVDLNITPLGKKPLHATFIRAPQFIKIGKNVKILSKLNDGNIVAAQEKNMLATCFHPELTSDTRLHEYFINLVKKSNYQN